MSPVEQGIAMGCSMPMVFMSVYYIAQRQKKQRDRGTTTES